MRPITLTFQAFGSYPGLVEIDFDALGRRGLFVVTGPTGTGKTTVFDAMVYALFGVLPGGRSADGEARSHFADPSTETYVRFTFDVDGARYTIHRTPTVERPKLRGGGTTTAAATAVIQRDAGGEVLATKVGDCTKAVEGLLGVNAKQFQRVVLLPQGKFTDFLIAGDEDREQLLRQLFGGELYERATKLLKDEADALYRQVAEVDEQMRHHLRNANAELGVVEEMWSERAEATQNDDEFPSAEQIADGADRMEAQRPAREAEVKRLGDERDTAVTVLANATSDAERFDRGRELTSTLLDLESSREQIAADAGRAASSATARPVVVARESLDRAENRVREAESRVESTRADVVTAVEALGADMPTFDTASVAAVVVAVSTAIESDRTVLGAANDAATRAAESERLLRESETVCDTSAAAIEELTTRRTELEGRISALKELVDRFESLSNNVVRAHETAERHARMVELGLELIDARTASESDRLAYEDTMRRFVLGAASRLAAELRDGEPCSVCGSTEHPNPASDVDDNAPDHDQVDATRTVWAAAEQRVATIAVSLDGERAFLGALADVDSAHVAADLHEAEKALAEAAAAVGESRQLSEDVSTIVSALDAAGTEHLAAATRAAELAGVASRDRSEALRLADVVKSIDISALDLRTGIVSELRGIAATLDDVFAERVAARTALSIARTVLDDTLASSGFASVEAARLALLDEDAERRFANSFDEWTTAMTSARAALTEIEALGVPAQRPDLEDVGERARVAGENADRATRDFNTACNALTSCRRALDDARAVSEGSVELRRRHDTARIVYRTCNGEAGARIKMERWVLAGELDRVAMAANVHLARMTNHRFALQRDTTSKGGLGLLVSDAHTGRPRATASLSGGEQFQASLALALGLADVVSLGGTGNGRTFEALFVDEGFGSLDPTALDQAIDALVQLHATGRMVGAITHVEAMKQSLHVGIEVRRLADGGGSTLVVNP